MRFLSALAVVTLAGCAADAPVTPRTPDGARSTTIVTLDEVPWGALNPARGEASPRAANLWGDRSAPGPSGFLVRFEEGFSSPPHIHNVTYRGVVIEGLIHNADPDAAEMWMPTGSYWTQPAGAPHVTAAAGARNLAYIEIADGPYLVHPTGEAFDQAERASNVDRANLVWLDASDLAWIHTGRGSARVALLRADQDAAGARAMLVELAPGFAGTLRSASGALRGVAVEGRPSVALDGADSARVLEPGGFFASEGPATHRIFSSADELSVLYLHTTGGIQIAPDHHGAPR